MNKTLLVFSNSRMAYDDVLSRTALALERGTLAEKITSADLAALYRKDRPLEQITIHLVIRALETLAAGTEGQIKLVPKFNKAILFSWLIFLVRGFASGNAPTSNTELKEFLSFFEHIRNSAFHSSDSEDIIVNDHVPATRLFATYETRSSSRVADVSSAILRDAVIWLFFETFCASLSNRNRRLAGLEKLHEAFQPLRLPEDDLLARRLIERG